MLNDVDARLVVRTAGYKIQRDLTFDGQASNRIFARGQGGRVSIEVRPEGKRHQIVQVADFVNGIEKPIVY